MDKIGYRVPIPVAFSILAITYFLVSGANNVYVSAIPIIIYSLAHGVRAMTE